MRALVSRTLGTNNMDVFHTSSLGSDHNKTTEFNEI